MTAWQRAPSAKLGAAGRLLTDGVDEFEVLVPAEGDDGVAAGGRRGGEPGTLEEFFGDGDGFQAGAALFADLEFVGLGEVVDEGAFGAVDFADVGALAAFAAAGGELGGFEDAGGAGFEVGEDGDPVVEVGGLAAADRR